MSTAREAIDAGRDAIAFSLMVTPAWVDVGVSGILYVLLNALAVAISGGDGPVGRLLALGGFAGLQQLAGQLPPSAWLKLDEDEARVSSSPLFQSGSPLAGVTFAFAFGLAVAVPAQLLGLEWVPAPRPWPEPERAALLLAVAPLSEEAFFRAFLLTAFERAGAPPSAGLIGSAACFALYHVPLAEMVRDGSLQLPLFELLGLYLAFCYQKSGGSLPFVVVTHATFNAVVTALRAAQVGSTLPFG